VSRPSGAAAVRPAKTSAVELDRVTVRVNARDATKTFEVLSREGAKQIEVEGGRFEFRVPPTRSCEVLRSLLEGKVDVFFFERRKGTPASPR
jgi:hypothetical protein